jgi:AcrR family transcriptional regulator
MSGGPRRWLNGGATVCDMSSRRPVVGTRSARPEGLNRETILTVALKLARRSGLDHFSMRDLAAELGTTQMAAYHYVKSRDELLTLLVDRILRDIRVPGPEHGAWDERLRTAAEAHLAVLRPWADSASVITRVKPARIFELFGEVVALLEEAGFSRHEAMLAGRMLRSWTLGELSVRQQGDRSEAAQESPPAGMPCLREAAKEPGFEDEVTGFTLDVLLEGLRARLRSRSEVGSSERADPIR